MKEETRAITESLALLRRHITTVDGSVLPFINNLYVYPALLIDALTLKLLEMEPPLRCYAPFIRPTFRSFFALRSSNAL
jgi:hypothetical protein